LRQAYAQHLLNESDQEIRITGSKAVLARAASEDADIRTPAVFGGKEKPPTSAAVPELAQAAAPSNAK
jgi:hypothetical protein